MDSTLGHFTRTPLMALLLGILIMTPHHAQAQDTPVGVWSRLVSYAFVREIIEVRPNGTYVSGLCGVIQMGWCTRGEATASREGQYELRGEGLVVDRGLVNVERHGATSEAPERYRWRTVRDLPDNPPRPTSRPPLRRLYLLDANGEQVMFNEMPAEFRPRWKPRADR